MTKAVVMPLLQTEMQMQATEQWDNHPLRCPLVYLVHLQVVQEIMLDLVLNKISVSVQGFNDYAFK